jgi:UDP-glucose:(heptosyl)LPS alpha-1,3-glucosyltransferase
MFPGGGLQRDCIEIACKVRDSGHEVVIYTSRLTGAVATVEIPTIVVPNRARTNHGCQYEFALSFVRQTSNEFDLVVGFDKLLGLDVLYCGDRSMRYRLLRRPYLGLLPRYRTYLGLEQDTFGPQQKTRIILLSQRQRIEYVDAWHTELERLIELTPTLSASRYKPEHRFDGCRGRVRSQIGLKQSDWVWLAIGVQPKTKGLDRVLHALKHFPKASLLVAGLNDTDVSSKKAIELAGKLGVSSRVIWLGHREDIEQIAAAADILMHPARYDTTGTVILEALVNGLPVITTSACGYASHVRAAGAGIVLDEPFDFQLYLTAIMEISDATRHTALSEAGIVYGQNKRLYEGRALAARIIVDMAENKHSDGGHMRRHWHDSHFADQSDNVVALSGSKAPRRH